MSRIGKKAITVPDAVKVDIKGSAVNVEGPKGKMSLDIDSRITVEQGEKELTVKRGSDHKDERALHGLYRSLIQNMITGVSEGFKKELEIQGIGYRAQAQGKKLVLELGYSHKIEFPVPEDINVTMQGQTNITVEGIDKQRVGQIAANIRAFRKPEPYKGKGIRYVGEYVRRKQGKRVG